VIPSKASQDKWILFRAGKTKQRIKIPMHDLLHDFLLECPRQIAEKLSCFPRWQVSARAGSLAFR